jgi:hypothetical protein
MSAFHIMKLSALRTISQYKKWRLFAVSSLGSEAHDGNPFKGDVTRNRNTYCTCSGTCNC